MALFGKLDGESISPLTSLYQATTDGQYDEASPIGSELDVWLYRNTKKQYDSRIWWSEQWESRFYPEVNNPEEHLRQWMTVQAAIVRLMDTAAMANIDGRYIAVDDVRIEDLDTINALLKEAFAPNQFLIDDERDERLVLQNSPRYMSTVESERLDLLRRLLTDFTEAFNESAFVYCEECKNVYPALRRNGRFAEEKIYCSERCSTRARQSRKREKEKAAA